MLCQIRWKSLTLDDFEGHWQPVWSAILATAGFLVEVWYNYSSYLFVCDCVDPCYDQSFEGRPQDHHQASRSSNDNVYSASIVAAICVVCVVVSIIVGFFLGFCVSQITHGYSRSSSAMRSSQVDVRSWRSVPTKDVTLDPAADRIVRQNPYDVEPVKTFRTFHPYDVSAANLAKQPYAPGHHNFYVNDLKPNNSKLANGPTTSETSLHVSRRGHYL